MMWQTKWGWILSKWGSDLAKCRLWLGTVLENRIAEKVHRLRTDLYSFSRLLSSSAGAPTSPDLVSSPFSSPFFVCFLLVVLLLLFLFLLFYLHCPSFWPSFSLSLSNIQSVLFNFKIFSFGSVCLLARRFRGGWAVQDDRGVCVCVFCGDCRLLVIEKPGRQRLQPLWPPIERTTIDFYREREREGEGEE